jgi:hypothetical protein
MVDLMVEARELLGSRIVDHLEEFHNTKHRN